MTAMRKTLIAMTATLGIALTACSAAPDAEIVKACDATAAAYDASTAAMFSGSESNLKASLDEFASLLSRYGDSLSGDVGKAFSDARAKLDAQNSFDDSLRDVNRICTDVGMRAVTDPKS